MECVEPARQKLLLFAIHHGPMNRLISRLWASALEDVAREETH